MPEETKKPTTPESANLEVEPLTDEDLEAASGGVGLVDQPSDCSCGSTTGNCTS